MTWHGAVTLTRQEQKGAMHRTPGTLPPNRLSSPVNGLPTDRPQGQVRPPRYPRISRSLSHLHCMRRASWHPAAPRRHIFCITPRRRREIVFFIGGHLIVSRQRPFSRYPFLSACAAKMPTAKSCWARRSRPHFRARETRDPRRRRRRPRVSLHIYASPD